MTRSHLFVAEMGGANCGLSHWGSHCQTAHAVSTSGPAGPYTRTDLALPHSCNPQVVRHKDKWLLFYIGRGSGPTPGPCPPDVPPPPPFLSTPAVRNPLCLRTLL